MTTTVAGAIRAAQALGTPLIRGFSFYPPPNSNREDHFKQAVDWLGQIADRCQASRVFLGIENEPNLMGENGAQCARIARELNHSNVGLVVDAGNMAAMNKSAEQCLAEVKEMLPYMLWMHVKDYEIDPNLTWAGTIDEEHLKNFVPCDDRGSAGHLAIFKHLAQELPGILARLQKLGLKGLFLDAEPHLKGGGKFGGWSGSDGMGVAVRTLCQRLTMAGIHFGLRSMDDIRVIRGF